MSDIPTQEIVNNLTSLLRSRYVFPDIGEQLATLIEVKLTSNQYSDIESEESLAIELTRDLQSINHDLHLTVSFKPDLVKLIRSSISTERPQDAPLKKTCGFEKVEMFTNKIGYLKLDEFADTKYAGDIAVKSIQKLIGAQAVIIDLRENGGGSPKMVQLLTTYFFGHDTVHLNNFYMRQSDALDQFWTLPYVPGDRLTDAAIYVLTSDDTFSAAEEFCYNLQNLKRATIIGEVTGGGAHPGDDHVLSDQLTTFIPHGRAINPISGTNWEGTGVKPDIEVDAKKALDVAIKLAEEHIARS